MPRNKYILLLFSVFLILAVINFPWGRWLLGWDNLVPEFNFAANIQRAIFSLWQENEGLGLIGGHGYAATLLHSIALFIASIVVPINYLRPLFTLTMLLIGSLGSFFLAGILLDAKEEKIRNRISFIAGLFYMLNFATVQMFYIPLEAFCVHFAALPWLLYTLILFFNKPNKKNLGFFSLISFLSTPQGFIPPLFLIYALFLVIFYVIFFIKKRTVISAKLIGLTLTVTVLANAYWLLPVGFYSLSKSQIYLASYNNLVTTDDFVLRSKKYGDLNSLVTMKGLLYDAFDSKGGGNIFYIFEPWKNHLNNYLVTGISYLIFLLILLGVYDSFKSRNLLRIIFAVFLFLSFTYLATDIFPFTFVSDLLRNNVPILKQAFRIGFTKFSISLALLYSIFLAFGTYFLFGKIGKLNKKSLNKVIFAGILLLIFYLSLPSFEGYFFYNRIKLKFPEEYKQVFDFFKSQNGDTRIADFPQAIPTGWSIYNWDYTGSGFWWYGLNQPILDRNFDVWGNFNENYYWELSQAIYSGNIDNLRNIFQKYQVRWLLVDPNLKGYISQKAINLNKLEGMISNIPEISLFKTFDKIQIYRVSLENSPQNFVFLADNLPAVGPGYKWGNYDKAYKEYGNYIADNKEQITNNKIYYPFRSLFTGRQQNELEFGVDDAGNDFSFKVKIPKELVGYKLILPQLDSKEVTEINVNDLSQSVQKIPQVYLDGELIQIPPPQGNPSATPGVSITLPYIREGNLEVRVPKINGYYSFNYQPSTTNQSPKSCDQFNSGIYKYDQIDIAGERLLQLTSIGSSNCLDFDMPLLSQDLSYLVTVQNKNVTGKSLLFSVINKNSQRADIETYLPKNKEQITNNKEPITSYFIQPPMEQYGLGYTIHLDNISIGREKTINDLGRITVNPIPYRFLTGLKIVNPSFNLQPTSPAGGPTTHNPQLLSVDHPNPSLYQITVNREQITNNNTTLILSQSYDGGWKAYTINGQKLSIINSLFPFWTGREIKDHVLVNNWENGWRLQPTTNNQQLTTIAIVYLSQYLEYIGFILLGAGALIVIFYPKPTTNYKLPTIN